MNVNVSPDSLRSALSRAASSTDLWARGGRVGALIMKSCTFLAHRQPLRNQCVGAPACIEFIDPLDTAFAPDNFHSYEEFLFRSVSSSAHNGLCIGSVLSLLIST